MSSFVERKKKSCMLSWWRELHTVWCSGKDAAAGDTLVQRRPHVWTQHPSKRTRPELRHSFCLLCTNIIIIYFSDKATAEASLFHTLRNCTMLVWRWGVLPHRQKEQREWWIMDKRWRTQKGLREEEPSAGQRWRSMHKGEKESDRDEIKKKCVTPSQSVRWRQISMESETFFFFPPGNFNNMLLI